MKWFKHDSDASNDAKLKKLRLKYGAQGYGIYWYCLELIARNVEKHNLTFELEHDAELIADDFKLSSELVQHIMTYMVELELFENTDGIISCLKMATRADEYTQQILRDNKKLALSRVTPESVPRISEVIEEKRTEDKRANKAPIPKDFTISERVISWANQNGHRDLQKHLDNFILVAQSNNYKYTDWDAAFMRAIKDNWAKVASKEVRLSL
jgi:hypothetical protein